MRNLKETYEELAEHIEKYYGNVIKISQIEDNDKKN